MYSLYSLLTLAVFVVVSPYFRLSGDPLQEVHRQPAAAPRLPADHVQRRRRGVDLDSRRVGRRGADGARARRRSQGALSAPAALPLDDDDRRAAGGAGAACRTSTRVFYFPFDWAFIVRRTLELVRPRLFIMMETEIWPNLLRECRAPRREDGR